MNAKERITMKHLMLLLSLLLLIVGGYVFAEETNRIQLNDGSIIYGDIVSLRGGVYTIKSPTLGTVRIKASKVRSIQTKPLSSGGQDQYQELQQKMMGDPDIINRILLLQNDPDIQAVLKDPAIMKAINAGDFNALMSNPKFMKLLNNPKIQDIGKKVLK